MSSANLTSKVASIAPDRLINPRDIAEDALGRLWIADINALRLTACAPYAFTAITDSGLTATGHFFLKWTSAPNTACLLESSTDLKNWSAAAPLFVSPGIELTYTDPFPAFTSPRKFFRIREP